MTTDVTPYVSAGLVGMLVLVVRELVPVLAKLVAGFSGRTTRLREQQAEKLAEAVDGRELEASNRRALQEYGSRLRRQMIDAGLQPEPEPEIYRTQDRSVLPTPRRKRP